MEMKVICNIVRATWLPAALLLIGLLAACGDGGGPEGGTAVDAAAGDASPPLYVVHSTVDTPSGRLGYFVGTPSIQGDVPVDIKSGIEEPGGGRLYAAPGIGTYLLGGGETPTLTRYEVAADGKLVRGAVLSFANQGVTSLADWAVVFVNPGKAYFRDRAQLQIIAFDPTKMELVKAIPLTAAAREGYVAEFGMAIKRDDGVYFPMWYWKSPVPETVPTGAVLVRVIPETDEVVVTTEARCSGLRYGFVSESGDAYWFSYWNTTVAWRFFGQPGLERDCALRLRPGQTTFDPGWSLDLTARAGGSPAVAYLHAGGTKLWMKVLDEAAAVPSPGAGAAWTDFLDLAAWQWHLLDVANPGPAQRDDSRPRDRAYTYPLVTDGRSFTVEWNQNDNVSTLVEMLPTGFVPRAKVSGYVRAVERLR
jgi:hypothetical protein